MPCAVQVKGLQSEYTRLVDSGNGGGGGSAKAAQPAEPSAAGSGELPAGEVAELRRLLGDVEQQCSDLQVGGGILGPAWLAACLPA